MWQFGVFSVGTGPFSFPKWFWKNPRLDHIFVPWLVRKTSVGDGDGDGPERDGSWLVKKFGLCVINCVDLFLFVVGNHHAYIICKYQVLPFVTFLGVLSKWPFQGFNISDLHFSDIKVSRIQEAGSCFFCWGVCWIENLRLHPVVQLVFVCFFRDCLFYLSIGFHVFCRCFCFCIPSIKF